MSAKAFSLSRDKFVTPNPYLTSKISQMFIHIVMGLALSLHEYKAITQDYL